MTGTDQEVRRVILVESSDALPGLFPFQAWDALGTAEVVLVRDPAAHPAVPHLYFAGLDVQQVRPATLDRGDLDLTRPGDPTDRRIAKALIARASQSSAPVVYLQGADDVGLAPALAGMAADHNVEIELVFLAQQPPGTEVLRLVEVMRRLRDPDEGCPWDLKQDHRSLLGYLVEETYELIEAVESDDDTHLVEELGDVLLQIVFHAQVARDRGAFAIDDVARGIADKLVRRHPHVFGDGDASTPEEVQARWDELKAEEKQDRTGPFDGVPAGLPALELLHELQRKAARLGFDWPTPAEAAAKVREELAELETATDPDGRTQELGDLLAAVVSLARHLGVDAAAAGRDAARRFRSRFEAVLAAAASEGVEPADLDPDAWRRLWEQAKRGPGPSR